MTKPADSPADTFDSMPVVQTVATPEQFAAFRQAYPAQWTVERSENQVKTTGVFASKEVYDAHVADPLYIAVKEAKDAWAEQNHITISVEKF